VGLARDTFACLGALGRLGEPRGSRSATAIFATHLFRTARLHAGWALSRVTAALTRVHGVRSRIIR